MGLTDYSDLEKELDSAKAPTILPRGTEELFRVIAVRSGVSDKYEGSPEYHQVVFDCPNDPMVVEFNDFFWDLKDEKKVGPKQAARNRYKFDQFRKAFKLDISKPFDWETSLIGLTGYIIVGIQKDDQYGDKNSVKQYVVGQQGRKLNAAEAAGLNDDDIPF